MGTENLPLIRTYRNIFSHKPDLASHNCLWQLKPILRKKMSRDLNQNSLLLKDPWLIAGDFNIVVDAEETTNPRYLNQKRCSSFIHWIPKHGLIDLGYSGPKFTWTRGISSEIFKGARLDYELSNTDWRIHFPQAEVIILPKVNSNHSPMLIILSRPQIPYLGKQFKF